MKKKINISDKTLKLIEQQKIKPTPKWEFIIKNWSLWLSLIFSLLFLVLGVSISWFGLIDNIIIPYLWLIIALFFLILAYLLFKKTKRSYRFQKWQVIILITIFGLMLGGIIFKIGLARQIDETLESRVSFYRQVVPMKIVIWNKPERGYLSGEIIKLNSTEDFQIKDFNNKIWQISGQNPFIRGRVKMVVGEEIKLIGEQIEIDKFIVSEVRPWRGRGQGMMEEN